MSVEGLVDQAEKKEKEKVGVSVVGGVETGEMQQKSRRNAWIVLVFNKNDEGM